VTEDGELRKFDIIALAPGFDSVTGRMKNKGLKDVKGRDLGEKWKQGTFSYMGMTCNGFRNIFFLYGAQGPTAFSKGPTCVKVQADWIVDAIRKMKKEHVKSIEATEEAEQAWHDLVKDVNDATLFSPRE
jgi:cation diffusion facilitator CzcD-associated flavoprotein CzcO